MVVRGMVLRETYFREHVGSRSGRRALPAAQRETAVDRVSWIWQACTRLIGLEVEELLTMCFACQPC